MEKIYLLQDDNGLKYVGRTKQKLNRRFNNHKCDKKRNHGCSSKKLDLDNCDIICLDIADSKEEAHELEEFYINSIDCVNEQKYNFDHKEYRKEYMKNYDHKGYNKEYREKNRDTIISDKRKLYHYQNTWGGEKRRENNLLKIDVNLFN
tara:strand:- start:152 stop:598 length:447 start_codon:yes stop_codon:yes gene_type:complete